MPISAHRRSLCRFVGHLLSDQKSATDYFKSSQSTPIKLGNPIADLQCQQTRLYLCLHAVDDVVTQ